MKKSIFLLAALAFIFSCNEKKKELAQNADVRIDNFNGHVQQSVSTDYKVDSSGKTGEQDSCCVVVAKYDENGWITEYNNNDKATPDKKSETFTHHENGLIKEVKMTTDGKTSSTINVKSENGKYISAVEYDSANKLKNYYTDLSQNDYALLTGMKKFNADSTLSTTMTSTYNKQYFTGNETKDSLGKVTYASTIKLDDKNNPIEVSEKEVIKDSTKNTVTKYKYDAFDKEGNWTERTEMDENGKPKKITKREITYYKD
ncbi:MAG: hypothetical protein ACTHK0_18535 [Ginsengibacter sp.]